MAEIDLQEFKPYVLEELKKSRNTDEIVLRLCEKTGAHWQAANQFVARMSEENRDEVVLAQSPLLVGMALFSFTAGSAMIVYNFYRAYSDCAGNLQCMPLYMAGHLSAILRLCIFGIILIVGSLKGMTEVWASIFNKLGI